MQPPKCPVCGKAEWRHLCSGQSQSEIGRRAERGKQQQRQQRRHGGEVAPPAGPKPLAVAMARIEELEGEVRQLKRLLADANAKLANAANNVNAVPANTVNVSSKPANTAKTDRKAYMRELMRKRRAAKKESKHV